MWFYYCLILFFFSLAWASRQRPDLARSHFKFSLGLVFLIVAFRYDVGCDWWGYEQHYLRQNPESFGEAIPSLDPLYWLLVDLISYLELPYVFLNIATSIIFFFGLYRLAIRFGQPMLILAFSFPVLVFAIPMSATRQALAMGFLMLAFSGLIDRRYIRFILLNILAAQFHASASVFLIFAPLVYFGGTLKAWILSSPILFLGAYLGTGSEAYEIASVRYIEGGSDALGAPFRTLLLSLIGAYFFLFLKKSWKERFPHSFPVANSAAYFLAASFPTSFLSPTIADRFGYYLYLFAAIFIAGIPDLRGKIAGRDLFIAMAGFFVFFIVWSTLSWQLSLCYVPYRTWIFGLPGLD
ncbi:MAG: EpsG family protein [Rhodovulum sp.]